MRAAMIVAMGISMGIVGGCCTWRDMTVGVTEQPVYRPWVAPGERGVVQVKSCDVALLAYRGVRLIDSNRTVLEESSDSAPWQYFNVPEGAVRAMLSEDMRLQWAQEMSICAAWIREHPDSESAPPRVEVTVFPVLVGVNPFVHIVTIDATLKGAAVPYYERDRLRSVAIPGDDFDHADLTVSPHMGLLEASSSLRFTSRDPLAWIVVNDGIRDVILIDPSDPDSMRVRTDWGWLVASFDEDGALKVEGVAGLSETAPQ